jgi:hypothetical protein
LVDPLERTSDMFSDPAPLAGLTEPGIAPVAFSTAVSPV